MQIDNVSTIEQQEYLAANPSNTVADFHAHNDFLCANWSHNVPTFFDWMDKVNGYYHDSWLIVNLSSYIVTMQDLDEWYLLFAFKYEGNFDYVLKCSMEYVHSKRKGIPLSA